MQLKKVKPIKDRSFHVESLDQPVSRGRKKKTCIPNIVHTWFRLNFDRAERKACFKDFLDRRSSTTQKSVHLIHYLISSGLDVLYVIFMYHKQPCMLLLNSFFTSTQVWMRTNEQKPQSAGESIQYIFLKHILWPELTKQWVTISCCPVIQVLCYHFDTLILIIKSPPPPPPNSQLFELVYCAAATGWHLWRKCKTAMRLDQCCNGSSLAALIYITTRCHILVVMSGSHGEKSGTLRRRLLYVWNDVAVADVKTKWEHLAWNVHSLSLLH